MKFTHVTMPWIVEEKSGLLFKIDQSGKIGTFEHTAHVLPHYFALCQAAVAQARDEFKVAGHTHCHRFGTRNSDLRRSLCQRVIDILNKQGAVLIKAA